MSNNIAVTSESKSLSALTQHFINNGHTYSNFDSDVEILHLCHKGNKMDVLEELEIYKHIHTNNHMVLNDKSKAKYNCLFETLIRSLYK